MPLKAVFFDLDGTLVDTATDFVLTLKQLANEYGVEQIGSDKIRQTVSNGAHALTTLLFGLNEGQEGFEERRQRLLEIYRTQAGSNCKLFEGMSSLLVKIREHQLHWGIVTNKPLLFSELIVDALDLPQAPDILICPEHVRRTKPDPEALWLSCAKINCKPQDVIYVGDHQRDIECGNRAGCETIAVSFGYIPSGTDIEAWGANHTVHHSDEIWPILQARQPFNGQ
ncbi:MAG: 2-phosphoglycolate phosphatase [Cellvibrionaceae bacterium]|jgi:2-phosphoglycolate phosphatase